MTTTTHRLVRFDGVNWVVVAPGAERVSFRSDDRGEAIARARRIVRNLGGGQVEICGEHGNVERVVTVTRSLAQEPDLRPR
jgi:hypothetical protein